MSPKRSSVAVALLLSSSFLIAVPIALICEYYPNWAAPALMGSFSLFSVAVIGSLLAFRRRRRAQVAEFGAGMGRRSAAICQSCGISGIGNFLAVFGGDFVRAIGIALVAIGICISAWHMFRAWPEGSHPGEVGKVQGIPPAA